MVGWWLGVRLVVRPMAMLGWIQVFGAYSPAQAAGVTVWGTDLKFSDLRGSLLSKGKP